MIKAQAIEQKQGGVRLDAALFLAFPSSTKAFVREAISSGKVLVNGRSISKGLKLRGGERIEVLELAEKADNLVAQNAAVRLDVVYEDASIVGVDKPAGMPVHPLTRNETETLANGVACRYPECAALGDRPLMAGALHRIDAGTSGLVLVARTAQAFENLRAQFAAQTVEKTYLALVEGAVAAGGTLENDLIHDPRLPYCRMIDGQRNRLTMAERAACRAFHAVTQYNPIGRTTVENEERTLLEVKIFTGVTHQIRAQLALAGMHIVNDRLYGGFAVENQVGHCLHALGAKFRHPVSGDEMAISTQLPQWAADVIRL